MNIKAILLGSAAALVAFSGARAADAIVAAEPEAVEYVRVCDAFGTGYFYIPGTETCLRIHGYTRVDIGGGDLFAATAADGDQTYNIRSRFSFRVSTASETELGTLRTYMETRWQYDTNDHFTGLGNANVDGYTNASEFSLNFAWIQLGGLRIGKDESLFSTFTGYGGSVIQDTLSGGYGPFDTNLISYTYTGGAFTAAIALEQGVGSGDGYFVSGSASRYYGWGIDDYMPHVVVGLGYNAGMFNVTAVGAYDTRDDIIGLGGFHAQGGWAGKIRADVTLSDAASVFAMLMYGENESGYTTWSNGVAGDETLSVIAGGSVKFSEKATFNVQGQWVDGGAGNDDAWSLVGNVAYNLVPGLTITPEVAYADDGVDGNFGAMLRVQRSF
ncbi:porin-like protein [Hoeflea marina]|uniref:Porin n=1 Tax=Hoeflea marina TaxID=274592 RepID=A0A317PHX6_9HYPH|nr:porin [Hoeflea marina]PWV98807.1 porin-like protein [Hoeflea marina]